MKLWIKGLFIFSGIFSGILFAFATPLANAGDVIVQIAFNDGIGLNHTDAWLNERTLRKLNPNARVITVEVDTPRLIGAGNPIYRNEMLRKISSIPLKPDDRIRALLISTHGGSSGDNTYLQYVGTMNSNGADADFTQFFAPLKPYFAQNLRVVLNACNSFVGPLDKVNPRVKAFLLSLNAPDGSLYGASGFHTIPGYILGKKFFKYAILYLIAQSYWDGATAAPGDPDFWSALLHNTISLGAEMVGFLGLYQLASLNKFVNFGRLYQMHNGELVHSVPASYMLNRAYLMKSLACNSLLK